MQCRFSQAALRKMYKILLGQITPPEDATPAFIEEGMSEVGGAALQAAERRTLLKVSAHWHARIPDE